MSLSAFELVREGFQESLNIGDVFESDNSKYVVILIGTIRPLYSNSIKLGIQVVAQKVGTSNSSEGLASSNPQKKRISFDNQLMRGSYIPRVGDFLTGDGDGIIHIVSDIRSISYDSTDMIIIYDSEIVQEWSRSELNDALRKSRLSKFKVIDGKPMTQ